MSIIVYYSNPSTNSRARVEATEATLDEVCKALRDAGNFIEHIAK